MSRSGKKPIEVPAKLLLLSHEDKVVIVKGPKGELTNII